MELEYVIYKLQTEYFISVNGEIQKGKEYVYYFIFDTIMYIPLKNCDDVLFLSFQHACSWIF